MCQQNKAAPWDDITMDFIIKLPESTDLVSKNKFNLIMVMVDRLTKYSILVPFREVFSVE